MEINADVKAIIKIDIDTPEAFRILCGTLKMDCVLDIEENDYTTVENKYGDLGVWKNGKLYDDRGKLFVALVDVARCIFPGL